MSTTQIQNKQRTAFIYLRVSTPQQQISEQLEIIKEYIARNNITVIGQYGDYEKRHKAQKRRSFQDMLADIEVLQPNMILVQRLDRFGTAGPNQLSSFLELLKKHRVHLVTCTDGMDRSREDIATVLQNVIAACQSRQEQIDKAERTLTGKRGKAVMGEYIGTKFVCYGFDVICIGSKGQEKWRLVEDSWDCRIKYSLDDNGNYIAVEQFGNEIIRDPNGIMPDKERRHRPKKDSSDRLYYSPSIREERCHTLRRMCELYDQGWTFYKIAKQFNEEQIKPVYSEAWTGSHIRHLLLNTVLIGKPAWNRRSQSEFRHWEKGRIVETEEEHRRVSCYNKSSEWMMPQEEIFEPIIPEDLFLRIQEQLEERKATPTHTPKSEELWLGGLWVCGETGLKLAGDRQSKCFRVKAPGHLDKRVTFDEAECFISTYLDRIGKRIEVLGQSVENNRLLETLGRDQFMAELRLEQLVLEIENYLEPRLHLGFNQVGNAEVILDYDDEGNKIITTTGSYLEIYSEMIREELEGSRKLLNDKRAERDRLMSEFLQIKSKNQFIIDSYTSHIEELDGEIKNIASPPNFREWWRAVVEEVRLLEQKQDRVNQAMKEGNLILKSKAIRGLISRIVCHWKRVPTTDGRYRNTGHKTICNAVDVHSSSGEIVNLERSKARKGGKDIAEEVMTLERSGA